MPNAGSVDSTPSFIDKSSLLAAIVESSDDAIISKTLDGIITSWNRGAERMFGYTAFEAIGQPVTILIPPDRQNEEPAILERVRRGERVDHYETIRRDKYGRLREVSLTVSAVRDAQGRIVGASKIAREISVVHETAERRQSEDALRQLNLGLERRVAECTRELALVNRELEAFTYSVAHDLRAPLRGITGYLGALQEDFADALSTSAQGYLQRSIECANRMQALVDDLLKLSRISRQELHRIPTPLNRLVTEVVEALRAETSARSIDWRISELPTLVCDPSLVRQVFANLLSNAVKYTRRQPATVIQVYQETRDDQPAIVVRDNGVGFDMRHAGNLFTPFFRMHTLQEFEGTGVGLATAERIVRRHGGRMWAEAELGQGAAFFFTLGDAPPATAND